MAQKLWIAKSVRNALSPQIVEEKPSCPECSKNNRVRFNGYKNQKRLCFCTECRRYFTFPYSDGGRRGSKPKDLPIPVKLPKPKKPSLPKISKPKVAIKEALPFLDTSNVLRFNKPKATVDSVFDVPCFCCYEANRGCNPNLCSKLETYILMGLD